ncbi:MAG TPA: GNAT family N-acetyltransferase [Gemmatimonadales bacterium]|nr:GNAT family N-acetyltransferase [Gemmatimonadales bacterium]
MDERQIREMEQDSDFAQWFAELVSESSESGDAAGWGSPVNDHYLVLSNEIGDWIGGLRFSVRGGVSQLLDVAVLPSERHQGYAHQLLAAFEERSREAGAQLAEFWTDDLESEPLLGALGWRRVLRREGYIGGRVWILLEKSLGADRD